MNDLRGNNKHVPVETGITGKIISAVIVAIGICAAGIYSYDGGMSFSPANQRVASSDVPSSASQPQ